MVDRSENGRAEMESKEKEEKGRNKYEGLPVDTSPYTQYKDLEDYKQQGYGTRGHLQPKPGRGAASSVDAPTEAGGLLKGQGQGEAPPAADAGRVRLH